MGWQGALKGGTTGAAAGSAIMPGWGTAIGGGIGAIAGYFGDDDDDDEKKRTDEILNQIPDELKQYLMPYIKTGMGATNRVGSEYDQLLKDPNALLSRIGAGYKPSPGYQWQLNQGENAINNAAAAGGMIGTGQHQQQAGQLAENLANQDYYHYLDKGLNLYGTGLSGEQGLSTQGYNASGDLATGIANMLMGQAGLNYKRQANSNQMNSDLTSSLLALLKGSGNSGMGGGSTPGYAQPTSGWGG